MTGTGQGGAPAGWYPDPGGPSGWRWWTGSEWTAYTTPDHREAVESGAALR